MGRLSIRKAAVIGAALATLGLSGAAAATAAPTAPQTAPLSPASSEYSGAGAGATRTTTNGSTQISTEPRNRRPLNDITRVYGPYVSPEQARIVAD
ncbi:hypothetical protein [Mycolicibacterium sp.]|uniref:hypothetical protein n=1 Tax=Mycolicibacterium sp. TaxID=2320850 RepID=UPI001D231153|nr:hypothetical protein [Mycolicibacterium sp.]MCB1290951.1 hypothetical protein [Mycobacterium sp.]MCB9410973.1 hypothetical protein [Mycolicibacterium sp.]